MAHRYVTFLKRYWLELNFFRWMWKHDRPAAVLLVLALTVYAGFIILPPILWPAIPPTIASPTMKPDQAEDAGKIGTP